MDANDHGAGTRSERDLKCPKCGANNRADAQWCGQCLERFEHAADAAEAEPESVVEPDPEVELDPIETLARQATLRREAMSELAGIAGDDEAAARFSTLMAEESSPVTEAEAVPGSNGHSASTVTKEPEPEVEAVIEGDKGVIEVKGKEITWTCSRCENVNGFEHNTCEVCGASFAEVIKEPSEPAPERNPNAVALLSLLFPGAGHAYIGMYGQAIARGVISLWVVVTAIFAAAQGASQSMALAVVFGIVFVGLWGVSAHDAYREASHQKSAVLLRDKLFLYLVLGLLLMSVVFVFSLAMGART
jgi:hypothetical protein